jgi:hypothetical protein
VINRELTEQAGVEARLARELAEQAIAEARRVRAHALEAQQACFNLRRARLE